MRIARAIHSVTTLARIVLSGTAGITAALLRGDVRLAGDRTRVLAWTLLQDCVQSVVLLQRRLFANQTPQSVDRVLVIKLDRIGDMVNTTPVFDALREMLPGARVDLLAHPTALSLLDGDTRIDERIPYRSWLYHPLPILPPGPRTWMLVGRLLRRRYRLVVFLRGSYSLLMLGFASRLAALKFVPEQPIVAQLLKPVESMYGPIVHAQPRLRVHEDCEQFAHELLRQGADDMDGPAVVIHASASNSTKIWPLDRMAAVADELASLYGARVHFLGSAADHAALGQLARFSTRRHAYHHALTLPQVVGVIASCDLFIGNDSGLSHIAAATGRRMIVLWGAASLRVCRPVAPTERCIILYHDVPCRAACPEITCVNHDRPIECLMRTQIADVMSAAGQLLGPDQRQTHSPGYRTVPLALVP